jgi:hypothetical protein
VETALLQEFRRHTRPWRNAAPVRSSGFRWLRWPVWVSAAALTAASALFLWIGQHPVRKAPTGPATVDSYESSEFDGFVPLPYAASANPTSEPDLVRVEMPRSTLIMMGVPGAAEETGDSVQAEVLLGDGGVPEAVRLVE